ncbi:hypothetical protein RDV78_01745 [Bacillota bacterium LX-D]|nr:hypothetical protein [Bacillota bacterium LX-D]
MNQQELNNSKCQGDCADCFGEDGDQCQESRPLVFTELENLKGVPPEVLAVSLGCSSPLISAQIKEGFTVFACGNLSILEILLAGSHAGHTGHVYVLPFASQTEVFFQLYQELVQEIGNIEILDDTSLLALGREKVDLLIGNFNNLEVEEAEEFWTEVQEILVPNGSIFVVDSTENNKKSKNILEKVCFKAIEIEPFFTMGKESSTILKAQK